MKYLTDSNVWIDAVAGRVPADDFLNLLSQAEWSGFSAITRLELFGFPGLTNAEEIRKQKRMKVPDAIIAATALVKDCVLLTRNTDDFVNIQGLTVINPYISCLVSGDQP